MEQNLYTACIVRERQLDWKQTDTNHLKQKRNTTTCQEQNASNFSVICQQFNKRGTFLPPQFPPWPFTHTENQTKGWEGKKSARFLSLALSLSFFPLPYIFHFPPIHLILFTLYIFFSINSPRHHHWERVEFVCVELSQWLESIDSVHKKDPLRFFHWFISVGYITESFAMVIQYLGLNVY